MRADANYQFALIDGHRAWQGVGLQKLLTNWEELEQWFHSSAAAKQVALGYISYEQQVYFGVFKRLEPVPLAELTDATAFQLAKIKGLPFTTYRHHLKVLQQHLAIGDIYQANYCYPLTAQTTATPQQLLHYFVQHQPTPYSALIATPDVQLVSNSPELGVRITGALVETRPMKGTRPIGPGQKQALLKSTKDKAELDMIIDVVRNDLAQFAVPGSVRVKADREIIKYKTVWQAQAVIQAQRHRTADSLTVIKAILPFASVTGAPKLRATELLKEVETEPRNVYCGGIGYIKGRTKAEFNVAIRTAQLNGGQLTYAVGSGITLDSEVKQEYQETLDKAKLIFKLQNRK